MPVTTKFSEHFYDRLGHEVASELVEWFNQVDATYRTEFRDLFASSADALDSKLERFRAQMDARFAEVYARMDRLAAEWEGRIGRLEAQLTARTDGLASDLSNLSDRFDARLDQRMGEVRLEIAGLRKDMAAFEARMIRWMFLMWVGTLGTVIGFLALR